MKPSPPGDSHATFRCSCGAVLAADEVVPHLATHGVDADTYGAALARNLVAETVDELERGGREDPAPKD